MNSIDFGGHRSKVKVMKGIIHKYGERRDIYTCYILNMYSLNFCDILLQILAPVDAVMSTKGLEEQVQERRRSLRERKDLRRKNSTEKAETG